MSISTTYRAAALATEAAEAALSAARQSILAACAGGACAEVLAGASGIVDRIALIAEDARNEQSRTPMFDDSGELEAPEAPESPEPDLLLSDPLTVLRSATEDVAATRARIAELHEIGADEAEIADAESDLYLAQTLVDAARDEAESHPLFREPEFGDGEPEFSPAA